MNQTIPMGNPLMAMIGMARNGGNPMQLVQQMAMQNPQMRQFMGMVQGKTPQQLQQLAENVARERGTTIDAVRQQLGL